jgi:hypothetical protein
MTSDFIPLPTGFLWCFARWSIALLFEELVQLMKVFIWTTPQERLNDVRFNRGYRPAAVFEARQGETYEGETHREE